MTQAPVVRPRYYRHPSDALRLILWASVAAVLAVFDTVSEATAEGLADDLASAASRAPSTVRELLLALVQIVAVGVPVVVAAVLVWQRRFRRIVTLLAAAAVGAGVWMIVDALLDLPGPGAHSVRASTWVASSSFPSVVFVAAAVAAIAVGKPWLSRAWRRASDVTIVLTVVVMAIAGNASLATLLLATSVGLCVGAALLLVSGAPDLRPSPEAVRAALRSTGIEVDDLHMVRADGGRAEVFRSDASSAPCVVKVYDQDSRDADLLYRACRAALFRGPYEAWPDRSLEATVEHEALVLVLAERAGVRCPQPMAIVKLPDASMVLAVTPVDGATLRETSADSVADDALDSVWQQVDRLHGARIAHRDLTSSNIVLAGRVPALVEMSVVETSASDVVLAMDRAELLAATSSVVGVERAVASAIRSVPLDRLATAMPYLQPLALSASTRKRVPKAQLLQIRDAVSEATGQEPPPIAQLSRVKARTLLMVTALAAAFYVLLPQLAHVGSSAEALRTASYGWIAVVLVMAALTYVASAVNIAGGIPRPVPLGANVECQLAASFVNRVTPANVGGIALNLRFLQKAGVDTAEAVPGLGLHVATGGIAHAILLVVFLAWAGKGGGTGFELPDESKLLAGLAIVLALVGLVLATRRGRRLVRARLVKFVKQSAASLARLARSPAKIMMLVGGAFGISLAYIGALAATAFAFHADVSFAQVGAIYLGASMIAAAAPTPGGLGAMEAALVAGFTGVNVESGVAVAIVLSYRLITYWLPVLPGWLSFHLLERRNLI